MQLHQAIMQAKRGRRVLAIGITRRLSTATAVQYTDDTVCGRVGNVVYRAINYMCEQVNMIIDRKTGTEVRAGDMLVRKDYKGFRHRYEVVEIILPHTIRVKKLSQGDRWVYLTMPIAALQLDEVML